MAVRLASLTSLYPPCDTGVIYLLNVAVCFQTGVTLRCGVRSRVVSDGRDTAALYASTALFVLDVLAVAPFVYLVRPCGRTSGYVTEPWLAVRTDGQSAGRLYEGVCPWAQPCGCRPHTYAALPPTAPAPALPSPPHHVRDSSPPCM